MINDRRLVTTLLLLTILALPAGAVSKRKQCAQACGSLIAACAARNQDLGDFRGACKTAVLRACRKAGPATCLAGIQTTSTTSTTSSSTTTTTLRFVDNGDGTVTDNQTGLMWEQKNSPDGVQFYGNSHDVDNLYGWSAGGIFRTGAAFTDFLARLDDSESDGTTEGGCFAGHCDWRLPTLMELEGIVDKSASGCGSGSPCINPIFGVTAATYYWSATTNATDPNFAWVQGFYAGFAGSGSKSDATYVRAVRSGS